VVGDLRLGQVKPANQLADAELAIGSEQLEDPQSDRVAHGLGSTSPRARSGAAWQAAVRVTVRWLRGGPLAARLKNMGLGVKSLR
jgi:hypothetical protein